jgi:hypothetical protein
MPAFANELARLIGAFHWCPSSRLERGCIRARSVRVNAWPRGAQQTAQHNGAARRSQIVFIELNDIVYLVEITDRPAGKHACLCSLCHRVVLGGAP